MVVKSYRAERVREIRRALTLKNYAAGILVSQEAKRLAPVDTGLLRASITYRADNEEVIIGTDVHYGKYQELGTRHHGPQPFLVPGLKNSEGRLRALYGGPVRGTFVGPPGGGGP